MHNNYYFLKALSRSLAGKLTGVRLSSCYTQEKDELILTFGNSPDEVIIRAHLHPSFSCLFFPESQIRAKKNTVDLFPEVTGKVVNEVVMHSNERAFSLKFDSDLSLTFKLFGNRSNIILFEGITAKRLFRSRLSQDFSLTYTELDRTLSLDRERFEQVSGNPLKFLPTLGKEGREYLIQHGYDTSEKRYEMIMDLVQKLEEARHFYVIEWGDTIALSLLEIGHIRATFSDPIEALNSFFLTYQKEGQLGKEKKSAKEKIIKEMERSRRYIEKNELRLLSLENETNYRIIADLIMANLYRLKQGQEEVDLEDLYHPDKIHTIRLKPELSPQRNAENYYRKAKNQHMETSRLSENITARKQQLSELNELLDKIEMTDSIRELRQLLNQPSYKENKDDDNTSYHILEWNGYRIWLGRNGKANDQILRNAHKDDLWMHAKDVAGAHVLVRASGGHGIPLPVKEKAAALAAYHSKGKNNSFCPVIATKRKYVRKRKGSPPGEVVVDREEEVLIVAPENWS